MPERSPLPARESTIAEAWGAGAGRALRLEDGRALRVIFPGVPGGGSGPDFRGAMLDAGGDYLRGDVEVHLRASGWEAHGHDGDDGYRGVVLHVVGENDGPAAVTRHRSGRTIPILVLRLTGSSFPPPFTPPCCFASERGYDVGAALRRMGGRRLRLKASRIAPLLASDGRDQALYTLLLETLAGPANRASFATLARNLPLAALIERAAGRTTPDRTLALEAELKGAAATLSLRRAGLRPAASPARRIAAAAKLIHRLWPEAGRESPLFGPGGAREPAAPLAAGSLLKLLKVEGVGRDMAAELAVNAVLPVLAAEGAGEAEQVLAELPAPATYGKLRSLERWLGHGERVFGSAAMIQGGLLLHSDYCTRGLCGRCPLSS